MEGATTLSIMPSLPYCSCNNPLKYSWSDKVIGCHFRVFKGFMN